MLFGNKFLTEDEIDEWFEEQKTLLEEELYNKINKNIDKKEEYESHYDEKMKKLQEQ